jgi:transposase-like protein
MGTRSPAIARLWDKTWDEFIPFLATSPASRPGIKAAKTARSA